MLQRKLFHAVIVALVFSLSAAPFAIAQEAAAPAKEVKKDVPYVPTPEPVVEKMMELAQIKKGDVVYDLGCGDGRLVIAAIKKGAERGVGVDIDPERIKESNENAKTAGVTDKVKFIQEDLFKMDFKETDVLTMYLLPRVNMQLRPKILDELKPGSRIVSHAFDMEDWDPDQQATVEPGGQQVYFWIVPAKVEGNWTASLKGGQGGGAGGDKQAKLKLTQKFQNVTGTANIDGKDVEIKDGKLAGDKLTFTLPAGEQAQRYTVTVKGNKMEGKSEGAGEFTAEKQ